MDHIAQIKKLLWNTETDRSPVGFNKPNPIVVLGRSVKLQGKFPKDQIAKATKELMGWV